MPMWDVALGQLWPVSRALGPRSDSGHFHGSIHDTRLCCASGCGNVTESVTAARWRGQRVRPLQQARVTSLTLAARCRTRLRRCGWTTAKAVGGAFSPFSRSQMVATKVAGPCVPMVPNGAREHQRRTMKSALHSTAGFELGNRCSIHLSYRGKARSALTRDQPALEEITM